MPADAASPRSAKTAARPAPAIRDFALIVGGMKCGSTSLYDYLVTHPQVAACRVKEPNFFSSPKAEEKFARYPSLWPDFDPERHRLALEASVSYAKLPRHPATARAIAAYRKAHGGDFRFLYILRNPIDRVESHIAHNISKGRCTHEDYAAHMRAALDTSRYATQLKRYVRLAGKRGPLLLSFDELKSDPLALLARCTDFLGLEDFAYEIQPPSNVRSAANDSTSFRLSEIERGWIRAALAEEMEELSRRYGFDVSGWGFGPGDKLAKTPRLRPARKGKGRGSRLQRLLEPARAGSA